MDTVQGVGDAISEDDVRLWLVESEEDAERAIRWIHDNYSRRVLRFLKTKFGSKVSLDDKMTALQEAYKTIWDRARTGKLNIDKPLLPLLLKIAHRKAIDRFRSETREKRTIPDEQYHEELQRAIGGTKIGSEFNMLETRDLVKAIEKDFHEWLTSGELMGRQFEVAHALAAGFPDILDPADIHEVLLNKSNDPPTYAAVKRAREIVLQKFREVVEKKYQGVWK